MAEDRRELRRHAIAEAALRVLSREGHARLTARKVAAESGMSLGHITYNFTSMDEVLAEAYRHASDQLREATARAMAQQGPGPGARSGDGSGTPMQRLAAFLHAGFGPGFLTPAHIRLRVDLWAAALWHPEIARTERALYARYRAALADLLLPLGGSAEARDEVADTIMAALDGLWADFARRQDHAAVERGLRGCLSLAALRLDPSGTGGHAAEPARSPR